MIALGVWRALGAIAYWALIALLAFGLTVLVRDAVIPWSSWSR